jgi:hypothetical protein
LQLSQLTVQFVREFLHQTLESHLVDQEVGAALVSFDFTQGQI